MTTTLDRMKASMLLVVSELRLAVEHSERSRELPTQSVFGDEFQSPAAFFCATAAIALSLAKLDLGIANEHARTVQP